MKSFVMQSAIKFRALLGTSCSTRHISCLAKTVLPAAAGSCHGGRHPRAQTKPCTDFRVRATTRQHTTDSMLSNSDAEDEGEEAEDTTWEDSLYEALCSVKPPGTYAVSAVCAKDLGGKRLMTIPGVGALSLPISKAQGAALLAAGEAAPYGKGMDTVYDPSVRRATQLSPSLVTPSNAWSRAVEEITQSATEQLGVKGCTVEAHLYKVLVYGPGGHFVPHRDTEKEPGMFGTLVIQVPVEGGHTGGSLEVRGPAGGSDKHVWCTEKDSSRSLQYAAFYADMEHALAPVTSGLRVVLTYNLVRTGEGPAPPPPASFYTPDVMETVQSAVKEWETGAVKVGHPFLAYRLEHKYTTTNLSFSNLKGKDQGVVALLQACPQLEVYLAQVKKTAHGEEDSWSGFQANEFTYSTRWVSPTGSIFTPPNLDTHYKKEVLGREWLFKGNDEDMEVPDHWDNLEYEYYTGNEGPVSEYIYHAAAVVFWPRSKAVNVAKESGIDSMLQVVENRLRDGDLAQAVADMRAVAQYAEEHSQARNSDVGAAAAFNLLLRLAQAAPDACSKDEASQMAVQLCRAMAAQGISTTEEAGVVAKAAQALTSTALNTALVSLVQGCASKQVQQCLHLVSGLKGAACQMAVFQAILDAVGLTATPPQLPASVKSPDVAALARAMLDTRTSKVPGTLARTHFKRLAAAVLAHPDSQALLQALLEDKVVGDNAKDPRVTPLVTARSAELESRTAAGAPIFSWEQVNAIVPGYPQVEAFLRGPQQEACFKLEFMDDYSRANWMWRFSDGSMGSGYSAKATVVKQESKVVHCNITKTKDHYHASVKQYHERLRELADLRILLS